MDDPELVTLSFGTCILTGNACTDDTQGWTHGFAWFDVNNCGVSEDVAFVWAEIKTINLYGIEGFFSFSHFDLKVKLR